jgi:hypothetical protein
MEDRLPSHSLLSRKRASFEEQMKRIKKAAEIAQQKIDYTVAHNEHILQAVDVVENFLRKKHRLCYGGQAINAHLPDKYKFYDPERTIPDYDFFTPQPEQDIRILVQDLKRAGFQEISAREGMHEGTVKIYVDYIPVADITAMDLALYRILSKRELRVHGISYMDSSSLRMMMYLELSRPRGEVERWPKVYERLLLLNSFASHKPCRPLPMEHGLTKSHVEFILQWAIQKHRVFAGLDLVQVYHQGLHRRSKRMEWLVHTRKPILLYSPTPDEDMKEIRDGLLNLDLASTSASSKPSSSKPSSSYRIQTKSRAGSGELLPTLTILYQGKHPLLFMVHQTACHSYFQLPLSPRSSSHSASSRSASTLRIASVDTLITLYFSLALMDDKYLDIRSMECLANQLIDVSIQMRSRPKDSPFPFISLNCAGHQTTLTSLVRAKVRRMTERKARLKTVLNLERPLSRYTIKRSKGKVTDSKGN